MNLIGFRTLFVKETMRFFKVYLQTLGAPLVTAVLYLLIFAHVLEGRAEVYPGLGYTAFLLPGLIMMSMIQNSFANSSSSLIQSKVVGNLFFVLVTPLSNIEIFLAFTLAAVTRGIVVGLSVYLIGWFFTALPIEHLFLTVAFTILSTFACAAMGVIAGIWAEKFDQMAGVTNFLITPLSFLSGVFYSIHSLPEFWQTVSHLNPFFYMIDGFRFGFHGVSDVDPFVGLTVLTGWVLVLSAVSITLLNSGYKLRD